MAVSSTASARLSSSPPLSICRHLRRKVLHRQQTGRRIPTSRPGAKLLRRAGKQDQTEAQRLLRPSELTGQPQGKRKRSADNDVTPGSYVGGYNSYMLSPSELGTSVGGLFSSITGKQKQEAVTFKEEPKRESLTQPPSGYQTPSSNYAYGTGPEKSETRTPYNPITDKGDPTLR